MRRMKQLTITILLLSLSVSACQHNSDNREAGKSPSLYVTPIESSRKSGEHNGNIQSDISSKEQITLPDDLFDEAFVVVDNSGGYANIYEINVDLPYSFSREWAANHPTVQADIGIINTDNWKYEYNLIWTVNWFMGKSFNYSIEPAPEHGELPEDYHEETYSPPKGILEETIGSIHVISIGSLPNYQELINYSGTQPIDSKWEIACFDIANDEFPVETGYFPNDYQILHLVGLSECYLDGIPLVGTMGYLAKPYGVFDYDPLVRSTIGGSLITNHTQFSRNKNYIASVLRTKDFEVKNVVEKNIPIKPLTECTAGIRDAFAYYEDSLNVRHVQIFAAELVYMPLSEYDISNGDYLDQGKTYLIPVWNLYYRNGSHLGFCCLSIDAVTGNAIYSKEYSPEDPRIYGNEI